MKLQEIMTDETFSCAPDDSLQVIAQSMRNHDIGSMPIVENGKVEGIVTDRDIVVEAIADNNTTASARDVMTPAPITGTPDMDVDEASITMAEYQIRRMPVVEDEQLVGYVAIGDLSTSNAADEEAGEALSEISRPSQPE